MIAFKSYHFTCKSSCSIFKLAQFECEMQIPGEYNSARFNRIKIYIFEYTWK